MSINTTPSYEYIQLLDDASAKAKALIVPVTEVIAEQVESPDNITDAVLLGQLLMDFFGEDIGRDTLSTETRKQLLDMAEWMGPDWAQVIYRAAVFLTKNA